MNARSAGGRIAYLPESGPTSPIAGTKLDSRRTGTSTCLMENESMIRRTGVGQGTGDRLQETGRGTNRAATLSLLGSPADFRLFICWFGLTPLLGTSAMPKGFGHFLKIGPRRIRRTEARTGLADRKLLSG